MLNLDSFSAGFLQTGQSYKFGFSELEVYKAVAGDLTNPAIFSHWGCPHRATVILHLAVIRCETIRIC